MKIAKIGWHSFSFHCKFCQKSGSHYYCTNRHSPTDGKECHEDICEMFKGAEEKAAPVQQTTGASTPLPPAVCEHGLPMGMMCDKCGRGDGLVG